MGVYSRLVKDNEPAAKKRFGQHFLRDTGVLDRIVRWIKPVPNDLFFEIGAGDGALSVRLAPRISRLIAVEVDRDRIPQLEMALKGFKSAIIVQGDILRLNSADLVSRLSHPQQQVRIAGNLPYNIATAIIEKLLHMPLIIQDMFFMVQLEVAQRILANPGSRQYGFLSVQCQHHAKVQMGFSVSPACFVPRPKVSSAMISFHPYDKRKDSVLECCFESLCKAAFSYRRKTLENSIGKHEVFGKNTSELLRIAGIDGSRRAEELSVREYEYLASVYMENFKEHEP
jgi:16S rRNA (adenine1518-N6/adenine1519-N6)-dimethyltransferase